MQILGMLGGILALIGWIWTIITAFKAGGNLWGILNIIPCIQPIVGIVSAAMKKAEWIPVIIMLVGVILSWIGNYSTMMEMMNGMPRT